MALFYCYLRSHQIDSKALKIRIGVIIRLELKRLRIDVVTFEISTPQRVITPIFGRLTGHEIHCTNRLKFGSALLAQAAHQLLIRSSG